MCRLNIEKERMRIPLALDSFFFFFSCVQVQQQQHTENVFYFVAFFDSFLSARHKLILY